MWISWSRYWNSFLPVFLSDNEPIAIYRAPQNSFPLISDTPSAVECPREKKTDWRSRVIRLRVTTRLSGNLWEIFRYRETASKNLKSIDEVYRWTALFWSHSGSKSSVRTFHVFTAELHVSPTRERVFRQIQLSNCTIFSFRWRKHWMNVWSSQSLNSPNGMSVRRQAAASAPAEAPEIFCSNSCGAYFLKHTATPTANENKQISGVFYCSTQVRGSHRDKLRESRNQRMRDCTSAPLATLFWFLSFSSVTRTFIL